MGTARKVKKLRGTFTGIYMADTFTPHKRNLDLKFELINEIQSKHRFHSGFVNPKCTRNILIGCHKYSSGEPRGHIDPLRWESIRKKTVAIQGYSLSMWKFYYRNFFSLILTRIVTDIPCTTVQIRRNNIWTPQVPANREYGLTEQ